jgi:hypothetical protein
MGAFPLYITLTAVGAVLPPFVIYAFFRLLVRRLPSNSPIGRAVRIRMALRYRASGIAVCLGWILQLVSLGPICFDAVTGIFHDAEDQTGVYTMWWLRTCIPFGIALFLLALQPSDARPILAMCIVVFALMVAAASVLVYGIAVLYTGPRYWQRQVLYSISLLGVVTCAVLLAPVLYPHTPARLRWLRLWLCFSVNFGLLGVSNLVWTIVLLGGACKSLAHGCTPARLDSLQLCVSRRGVPAIGSSEIRGWESDLVFAGCCVLTSTLGFHDRLRARITQALLRLGVAEHEATERESAAFVGGMIGGARAMQASSDAEARFRVLPLLNLTEADLGTDTNLANKTALAKLTKPAALGDCDAFVSHSWRDDGSIKFNLLRSWGQTVGPHAPTIWLDKAWCARARNSWHALLAPTAVARRIHSRSIGCSRPPFGISRSIDQTNIEESLFCLPLFISACKVLLVLAGPTCMPRPALERS